MGSCLISTATAQRLEAVSLILEVNYFLHGNMGQHNAYSNCTETNNFTEELICMKDDVQVSLRHALNVHNVSFFMSFEGRRGTSSLWGKVFF